MIRKTLCVALLLVLAAPLATQASGPKLYRWVDKQGKVHYDDALPPEAVDQARREFSTRTGAVTGSVDRALTPEERAQQAAAAKAAALAAEEAGKDRRQEEIMMAAYQTEADVTRAYNERISLLKMTLESTDVSIRSLTDNLTSMLAQASEAELENRKVVEDRQVAIRGLHAERVKQLALQSTRSANLAQLQAEFVRVLARFRELKAASAASDSAAVGGAAVVPAPPQT